jgi:beta-phosphoglucomutase-like phosphatase (HAD superfamily)
MFRERAGGGSTVAEAARAAVREAASRVPVGIVSGDYRDEIELLLAGAGLRGLVSVLVAIEDVERPKPDPAQYLLALEQLDDGVCADQVLVFEDTPVGVAAAKAAGMRCVAVLGTVAAERLSAADEIVERLDAEVVARSLAS